MYSILLYSTGAFIYVVKPRSSRVKESTIISKSSSSSTRSKYQLVRYSSSTLHCEGTVNESHDTSSLQRRHGCAFVLKRACMYLSLDSSSSWSGSRSRSEPQFRASISAACYSASRSALLLLVNQFQLSHAPSKSNPIPVPTRLTIHFLRNSSRPSPLISRLQTSLPTLPRTNASSRACIAASHARCSATLSYNCRATTVGGMMRSSILGIECDFDRAWVMVVSAAARVEVSAEMLDWRCDWRILSCSSSDVSVF